MQRPSQCKTAVKCVPREVLSSISETEPYWVFLGNPLNTNTSMKSKLRGFNQSLQIRDVRGIAHCGQPFMGQLKDNIVAASIGTAGLSKVVVVCCHSWTSALKHFASSKAAEQWVVDFFGSIYRPTVLPPHNSCVIHSLFMVNASVIYKVPRTFLN